MSRARLKQEIIDYATIRAGQMRARTMLPYLSNRGHLLANISHALDELEIEGKIIDCGATRGPVDWELIKNG